LAELMDAEVREVVGPKGRSPKFHDERDILLMIAGARERSPGESPAPSGPFCLARAP
jgi:hypothetical protein